MTSWPTLFTRGATHTVLQSSTAACGWVNALGVGSATTRRIVLSQSRALHKAALCEPRKGRRLLLGEHLSTADQHPQHSFLFRWKIAESHFLFLCILIKNTFRKQGPACILLQEHDAPSTAADRRAGCGQTCALTAPPQHILVPFLVQFCAGS